MRKIALVAAIALGMGMLSLPAAAQTQNVTQAQVVAACTTANNIDQCKALIATFVATFPAGSIVLQQAIADLVVALAESPAASDPALKAVVSEAINEVAAKSPDPTQQAQIVAIAQTVAAPGEVQTAAIIVNRPPSPN